MFCRFLTRAGGSPPEVKPRMSRFTPSLRRRFSMLAGLVVLLAIAACAPVSVERVDLRTAYEDLNRTALSGNQMSDLTRIVLRRSALLDSFSTYPNETIAALRAVAIRDGMTWQDLYALSELSYFEGRQTKSAPMLLASALYAYAVLFPNGNAERPSSYSAQFRQAADFYNLALTQVLTSESGDAAVLRSGRFDLPFGTIDVTLDKASLETGGRVMASFVPTMNLEVNGFQNDYRSDGLGAPLAAGLAPAATPQTGLELPTFLRIPTSAVLQMDDPRRQLTGNTIAARLSVYTIFDSPTIRIGAQDVPLEFDQTAVRALITTEGRGWSSELSGLLGDSQTSARTTARLVALEPHRRGRMPVVLVHGTASSPFRWADMVNDLMEDRKIGDHYEFWFFSYGTGNPVALSALLLRRSLEQAVQSLGGAQSDPALGRMVVIGHSQGGLLTRMISIESGTTLWDALSSRPIDALNLMPETRTLLQDALFVHPLPFVETVIFIATPHRGSYLAGFSLARAFTKLITLPLNVVSGTADLLTRNRDALRLDPAASNFSSISGMSPSNPVMKAMAAMPVAPPIHAHSIIPTLGDEPLEERDDGVVTYRSAHLDGVQSELIVNHSGHSTQANPITIDEVRRILIEQLNRRSPARP